MYFAWYLPVGSYTADRRLSAIVFRCLYSTDSGDQIAECRGFKKPQEWSMAFVSDHCPGISGSSNFSHFKSGRESIAAQRGAVLHIDRRRYGQHHQSDLSDVCDPCGKTGKTQ